MGGTGKSGTTARNFFRLSRGEDTSREKILTEEKKKRGGSTRRKQKNSGSLSEKSDRRGKKFT